MSILKFWRASEQKGRSGERALLKEGEKCRNAQEKETSFRMEGWGRHEGPVSLIPLDSNTHDAQYPLGGWPGSVPSPRSWIFWVGGRGRREGQPFKLTVAIY